MTRFEDFDCCLQFTWFNRATHPKHQSSNAVTPQSCLSPFPTLGELVACPPLPTGRGGSRVQAGGGLRSEGVARLPDACTQRPACGQLPPTAGSSRSAQLGCLGFLPSLLFPFLFPPPFLFFPSLSPAKRVGKEGRWLELTPRERRCGAPGFSASRARPCNGFQSAGFLRLFLDVLF